MAEGTLYGRGGQTGIGTGARARKPKKGPEQVGGYYAPPEMSFDPAIEAERRAGRRGLHDIQQDIRIEGRRDKQDLSQALRDIRTKRKRGFQDLSTDYARGQQKLGFQQHDANLRAQRAREDFGTQLANLTRQFSVLGRRQAQAANAAGTLEGGTLAAAAQARQGNFEIGKQQIDVARARTEQDLASALARIGIARHQLRQDTGRERTRLTADTHRDQRLSVQDFRRGKKDRYLKGQRAVREQKISDLDLLKQEIYQARQNRPGAFTKYGKKKGNKKDG